MKRRFSGGRYGGTVIGEESVNPMDGVANLADVMLVLAVGFVLALIINWNVDVSAATKTDVKEPPALTEIESSANGDETTLDDETAYEELNVTVFRDPETGKLYMVENGND
jgi:hypothetical protein